VFIVQWPAMAAQDDGPISQKQSADYIYKVLIIPLLSKKIKNN
jgi:hypothetical protein